MGVQAAQVKRASAAALLASALSLPSLAMPSVADPQALGQGHGCNSCHATHEKIVGPAWASIAQKYAADADAEATLMQSVRRGSQGKWGRAAMPPHPNLSDDELRLLVRAVLRTPAAAKP
ncbi:c-type cytochrome [Roseateles sp. BYS180W]|uniref:C-type cytochrome n=1 Tax=Roseateles rivi TaxID=3299028 RepID=A0ABW7FRU0_9BURK